HGQLIRPGPATNEHGGCLTRQTGRAIHRPHALIVPAGTGLVLLGDRLRGLGRQKPIARRDPIAGRHFQMNRYVALVSSRRSGRPTESFGHAAVDHPAVDPIGLRRTVPERWWVAP